jgi:Na+/H+ antiporter NhaC
MKRLAEHARWCGLLLGWLLLCEAHLHAGEVQLPSVALTGVPFEIAANGFAPRTQFQIRFEDAKNNLLAQAEAIADESGAVSLQVRVSQAGAARYVWQAGEASGSGTLRVIPAWWSLLPPLLAIALALWLRQVTLALVGGVWLGAWLIAGGEPFTPLLRVVDTYLLDAYADREHLQIVLFTLLLGGMLGVITRAGGLRAIVRVLGRRVRSDRGVQLSAYLLGLLIFIDDYANTLFVGATMRPLADRYRVSREKLAYLIDSTAAPVANLALIGTWIGFEVSVIADSFKASGIALEPYWAFLLSLPYRFYPIFTLVFIAWLLVWRRDFGAMYRAEVRARTTGKVLADGASPLAHYDSAELTPPDHLQGSLWGAALPILTALGGAIGGLVYTGYYGALAAGDPITLRAVLSNANSYISLVWGALLGCIVALLCVGLTRALSLRESFEAWLGGIRSMVLAVVILGLAWSIGAVCEALHTAQYLVQALQGVISPVWLPALTTLTAAAISFAIGSSWGTMSLLMPLAVPLVHTLTAGLGAEAQQFYLIATISSVLAGATFGDHCSPISDTTVLSSIFAGSDHIDHVRTQLPYALTVGAVAWLVGDVATAFGLPVWAALGIGIALLGAIVRMVGKSTPAYSLPTEQANQTPIVQVRMPIRDGLWVGVQVALLGLYGALLLGTPAGEWDGWRWLGIPLMLVGIGVLLPALWAHGRQLTPLPEPKRELGLLRTGVYASIRHPIYAGLIALAFGLALWFQKVAALGGAILLTLFFNLKAREEERRLRRLYPEYADYQRQTGRFLPRWRKKAI